MKNDLSAEQLQQLVTVTLPLGVVLRITTNGEKPLSAPVSLASLPAIGTAWASFDQTRGGHSGIYAGLSLENERAIALVLLPEEIEASWKDAMDWADKQDGELPSRIDQLVLFKNLKSKFREAAYWSCAPYIGAESYAWCQHFDNGDQNDNRKTHKLRARAVRRIAI